MMSKLKLAAIVLVGVCLQGILSVRLSVSKLDDNQKGSLREFRRDVEKDLPQGYMKDDAFLLRFLAAKHFNLKEAKSFLKYNLAWRETEKIDSILDEDWSDYEKRFPYDVASVNKEGRPVLHYKFGQWDISREATSGDFDRLVRYVTAKMMEDADRKVRSMRKSADDDVTQFDILIDLDGYNMEKHGCIQCIAFYRELMQKSERQYAGAVAHTFIVNAPSIFETIYPVISRAFAMEETRQTTRVLGARESYEPVLLQYMDKDQFPKTLM